MSTTEEKSLNFIENIVEEDLKAYKKAESILTRFPPEPNGFLHIGHAKSIVLNFGLGLQYQGKTNLRFDDTNPVTEDTKYVEAIKRDIQWLGYEWNVEVLYASNYFDQLYGFAIELIKAGKAYVDDSSLEEIRRMRGVPTSPGEESPFRNRSAKENIDLFERMNAGEFEEGSRVLRAKIDMTSPNMHMRDPLCIAFCTNITFAQVINGIFIPCMTGLMDKVMLLKALHILFVHWNLRCIALYTIGISIK